MHPKRAHLLAAIAICAAVLAGCGDEDVRIEFEPDSPAGSPVTIRFHPTEGLSKSFRADFDMDMDMEADGEDVGMSMKMGVEFTLSVESVDESGAAKVKATYDALSMNLRVSTKNVDERMRYDSKTGVADPARMNVLGKMVGRSLRMQLRPDGSVAKLEGLNELLREIGGGPAAKNLESMSGMYEQMTMFFPDHPVDNGDTWTKTYETRLPAPMKMELDCVLLSHDETTATVGINAEISLTGLIGDSNASKADVNGTMGGKTVVDLATGLVKSMEARMKLSGEMTANGQEVELEVDAHIRYSTLP
jgi:hypothetical protein